MHNVIDNTRVDTGGIKLHSDLGIHSNMAKSILRYQTMESL